jgi:flagellar M-ring protein FliF
LAGLSSRQLAVQREVETYMEQKANKLLSSLVGSGNASVQVAASINFDKVERTTHGVDPDKQALATEQKSEVTPSSPQQGAGYSQTATSYENTRSTENFSGAIGNLKRLTVAVLIADKVAPLDANAKPAATAAVPTPRTPDELTRIETLVRNALGVDSTRGDMISVVSAPFNVPAPLIVKKDSLVAPDMMARLQTNPKPLVAIAALVVLLIVAVVAMGALKPAKKTPAELAVAQRAALSSGHGYPELPASSQFQAAMNGSNEMQQFPVEERRPVVLPPPMTTPEREQAIATVEQRPDAALRVTRGWLRT